MSDLPIVSIDDLRKINDRPERTIPVPAWGASVVVKELDVRTEMLILKSATKENGDLDNEDFGVKTILEGFVSPKLSPQDIDMVRSWGSATIEYLVGKIRNRKKNDLTKT